MSVKIGDRATFKGEAGIITGEASFLDNRRWHFRYRNGKAPTGWSTMVADESALTSVTTPTWEIGDSVRVGFTPIRKTGEVTAITTVGGRAIYEVTFPDKKQETDEGTRWLQDAHSSLVGAEFVDTSS